MSKQLDEPALPLTIQTTIPVLTSLLFTLSLAMLGFIVSVEKWPSWVLPVIGSSSKDVVLWLLPLSAFLFLFTATGCVKAQAWDYFSIGSERRTEEKLSNEQVYVNKCYNYSWTWYKVAIWSYTFGVILLLLGIAVLFWPVSRITSVMALVSIGLPLIVKLADAWFSRNIKWETRRQNLLKFFLGNTYRT
jgi:hypothetical protein